MRSSIGSASESARKSRNVSAWAEMPVAVPVMTISAAQCRAGRALIGWSQSDLERTAKVAKKTIADFERDARPRTSGLLKRLAADIEFLPDNGVRLRAKASE